MNSKKSGTKNTINNRNQILVKEREDNWYIPPSKGIPIYQSEVDPYCPTAKLRKFNEDKRIKAKELSVQDRNTNQWIQSTLQPNFEDLSVNVQNTKRTKGTVAGSGLNAAAAVKNHKAYAEVEVLQKIVVRENLLAELHRLLKSQNDVSVCLGEALELIKALRFQTLDIIEDISSWQQVQRTAKAFMFKGFNYLVKIKCDLDFLDFYEEVSERVGFSFKSNPLAYRGGGNIITGYDFNKRQFSEGLMDSYYNSSDASFLDGVEVERLHTAEKIIQNEFNRLAREKDSSNQIAGDNDLADILNRDIFNAMSKSLSSFEEKEGTAFSPGKAPQQSNSPSGQPSSSVAAAAATTSLTRRIASKATTGAGAGAGAGDNTRKKKKISRSSSASGVPTSKSVFNPRKIKQERIATLADEAGELKAMMSHVEDQMAVLWEKHNWMVDKRSFLEERLKEARELGREISAQHIQAEMSVNVAAMQENQAKIKDLQRENYFIDSERKRKLGVMQKLKNEITEAKRKAQLQKKIEAMIKKHGLSAALELFHGDVDSVSELNAIGAKAGARMEWGSSSKEQIVDSTSPTQAATAAGIDFDSDDDDAIDNVGFADAGGTGEDGVEEENDGDEDHDDAHIERNTINDSDYSSVYGEESMVSEMRLLEDSKDSLTHHDTEATAISRSVSDQRSSYKGRNYDYESDNSAVLGSSREVDGGSAAGEATVSDSLIVQGSDLISSQQVPVTYDGSVSLTSTVTSIAASSAGSSDRVEEKKSPLRVRFADADSTDNYREFTAADGVDDPLRLSLKSTASDGAAVGIAMTYPGTPNSFSSSLNSAAHSNGAVANNLFAGSESDNLLHSSAAAATTIAADSAASSSVATTSAAANSSVASHSPSELESGSSQQAELISPMTEADSPASSILSPLHGRSPHHTDADESPYANSNLRLAAAAGSDSKQLQQTAFSEQSPLSASDEMYVSDDDGVQSTRSYSNETVSTPQQQQNQQYLQQSKGFSSNDGDSSHSVAASTGELEYPLDQLPLAHTAYEEGVTLETSPYSKANDSTASSAPAKTHDANFCRSNSETNSALDAEYTGEDDEQEDPASLDRYMSSHSFADGEYPAGSALAAAKSSRKTSAPTTPAAVTVIDSIIVDDTNDS